MTSKSGMTGPFEHLPKDHDAPWHPTQNKATNTIDSFNISKSL